MQFYVNDITYEDWIFVNIVRLASVQLLVNLMQRTLISICTREHNVFELMMFRDSLCSLPDVHFTLSDVFGAITFLCTY